MANLTKTRSRPRISILIITKNRTDDLRTCLESIFQQTVPFEKVIVVDSSTDDETKMYVTSLQESHTITYVFEPEKGYAAARNRGIRMTHTRWTASVDDDCILEPTWGSAMMRAVETHPKTDVFIGQCQTAHPTNVWSLTMQYYERMWKMGAIKNGSVIDPEIFDTKNLLVKTSLFHSHHLRFRQETVNDRLLSTDDIDMGMQLAGHDVAGTYVPDAIVKHKDPTTVRSLMRKILFDRMSYRHYEKRWKRMRNMYMKKRITVPPEHIFTNLKNTYHLSPLKTAILRMCVRYINALITYAEETRI